MCKIEDLISPTLLFYFFFKHSKTQIYRHGNCISVSKRGQSVVVANFFLEDVHHDVSHALFVLERDIAHELPCGECADKV